MYQWITPEPDTRQVFHTQRKLCARVVLTGVASVLPHNLQIVDEDRLALASSPTLTKPPSRPHIKEFTPKPNFFLGSGLRFEV